MIVDFKVFDVGVQKALNIKTFSCDWFGKSIIGKKKTSTTKNKQWKQKTKVPLSKKEWKKNPHKFDDPLSLLVSDGSAF